ncbi:hypothetical protein IW262DRAFT_1462147 [Armillaria fumosa]|nr:hypothetical protein IW262DRAFT_1462147 [Armillaria fumosa]
MGQEDYGHPIDAYALELGTAGSAFERIEMGWDIVRRQLDNVRSPVHSLSDAYPELAEDLTHVAVNLEKGQRFKELSLEDKAKEHHRLVKRWDSLVETVWDAAKLGPVLINPYRVRCDALVLVPSRDNILHISIKD